MSFSEMLLQPMCVGGDVRRKTYLGDIVGKKKTIEYDEGILC